MPTLIMLHTCTPRTLTMRRSIRPYSTTYGRLAKPISRVALYCSITCTLANFSRSTSECDKCDVSISRVALYCSITRTSANFSRSTSECHGCGDLWCAGMQQGPLVCRKQSSPHCTRICRQTIPPLSTPLVSHHTITLIRTPSRMRRQTMMLQVAQLAVAFVAAGAYVFIMLLPFIQVRALSRSISRSTGGTSSLCCYPSSRCAVRPYLLDLDRSASHTLDSGLLCRLVPSPSSRHALMMPIPFILYILTIRACWVETRRVGRCPCRLLDQLHPFLANLRARGSRRGAAFAEPLWLSSLTLPVP